MNIGKHGKRHLPLWLLMVGFFTIVLSLLIAVLILAFRFFLADRYEEGLHRQLALAQTELRRGNFSVETAQSMSDLALHILLINDADGSLLFRDTQGFPLTHGPGPAKSRSGPAVSDGELLRELVEQTIGQKDGSFYITDIGAQEDSHRLDNKALFLCGREAGKIYCLYLPVESTNAAITLAIRYTTVTSLVAWVISVILLYFLSKLITRPHRRIGETAAQIADMDFSRRCPEALTIELNSLSQSINTMADSLESNIEALRGANEQLQVELSERTRQQKITSDLIANLSHDLKTPIAIISGYAEGLMEGVAHTPEKQRGYYEMILRESEHMQAIVSRILALGRMESGETPITPERFDLTLLLDELLDSFQRELERQGLCLERVGKRPCMVYTDYACARQSLQNYIQNAISHINNGNQIQVRLLDLGDRVRVRVANSSSPISPEEARKLWDKLYRGDPSRQRHNGEMGLGLAIVKGNMERLGHRYGFENDPDFPGVAFWLELPKSE